MSENTRRRRKGRTALTALVALAAGGALTAALLSRSDNSQAADKTAAALPPNTAKVTQRTLTDTQTADGELGYGTTTNATSRLPGTLTSVPESGQQISRGQPLYEVNDNPVTLLYGALPAYRRLATDSEGPDVKQLEQNLRALGYTGFTVDDEYTSATAAAVEEWQDDLGLDETGIVELGQVVFAPGAVRVDSRSAQAGDAVGPGQKVLTYTGTAKAVTVELAAADQRLAKKGARVTVTLPDDTTVAGRVDEVSTIIVPASNPDQSPETKVEVIVALDNQKSAAAYTLASVNVTFTAAERKNVLTVPVAALLALQEGGFGVEVTDASSSRYVPVKTGLFAGGQVEISGTGIAKGVTVGVPK
jgi:peptidoglycan hydrolase-like protein with peptidoglycan-binding domain